MGRVKQLLLEQEYSEPFEHLKDDGFTPDIDLSDYDLEDASEVIKSWFRTFFEDPAQEMPYNGREGGYLYIWGGPYTAADEIYDAFESLASKEAIELAISELDDECYEWAPSSRHPDQVSVALEFAESHSEWMDENDPQTIFQTACLQISSTSDGLEDTDRNQPFILRMLYAQAYSTLEAYLYDKLRRTLEQYSQAMENYCKNYTPMSKITYSPAQVLSGKIDIRKIAIEVLGKEIFHRFDKVIKIYEASCGEEFPKSRDVESAIGALENGLLLRHDCVHRNGHNHAGEMQEVTAEKIRDVISCSQILVDSIESFVGTTEAVGSF
ncbi:MAG: hypothetical protein VR75_08990 [Hyphomonadaceae bacterium BRH_c29]|jgi:hypothetical protein|nr:MAG: hypothetical protein VR75_08990 [Hyphomonadaceae bacterium BRH_c29]